MNNANGTTPFNSNSRVIVRLFSHEQREAMIEKLIANDIDIIEQERHDSNSNNYLRQVLRGGGWTQYSHMSDAELQQEYACVCGMPD